MSGRPPPGRSSYSPRKLKFRPPVGEMLLDGDDNLLVQRRDLFATGPDPSAPYVWDVVAPGWRVVGRFHVASDLRIMAFRGCALYAVRTHALGRQTIVRFALEPSPLGR